MSAPRAGADAGVRGRCFPAPPLVLGVGSDRGRMRGGGLRPRGESSASLAGCGALFESAPLEVVATGMTLIVMSWYGNGWSERAVRASWWHVSW